MAKQRKWACPKGKHLTIMGPLRPRKIDVRRYCLPCSEDEGVLVERVSPLLERKKREKEERKNRPRRDVKGGAYPGSLHAFFKMWRNLAAFDGCVPLDTKLVVHRRSEHNSSSSR